ncbi:MAG: hypothetical protein ABMB14_13675 [Myxococcota bacterium]
MSGGSDDLAARLLGWDGSAEAAHALRAEVAAIGELRPKGAVPPGTRALAKAADLYRSRDPSPRGLGAWILKDGNADEARALAPLIGDPALGRWPYLDPLALSEADTVTWARVLAALRPVVDDAIRRFVRVAFLVRRRQTWPSACRAWAALAIGDAGLREALRETWARCLPAVGDKWPKTGLSKVELGPGTAHLVRHTLFLGCCWRALGGDPAIAGLDGTKLAGMPLPADDADRSVIVLGLTELLPTDPHGISKLLVRRAGELGADELSEAAVRELLARLEPGPAAAAIRAALIAPRWQPARIDGLWEWIVTAAWFADRGDDDAVAQIVAAAGEATDAIRWRIGSDHPADPVDGLIARLRQLLDPDRFAVVPERRRAPLIAETRLLMATADAGPLPWESVVRVACPAAARGALRGTVAQIGEPSLCVTLAERSLTIRTLMRDVVLDPDNVLRIGAIQDGFVAGQVAVQAERILRELPTPTDQVRFLWNLLQQDPPYKTFAELGIVLRTELGSTGASNLAAMVRAVSALDQRRDEHADVPSIAAAFAELVSAATALLGPADPVGTALGGLATALRDAVRQEIDPLDDEAWLTTFEDVALGSDPRGGLVGFAWWLAGSRTDAGGSLAEKRGGAVKAANRLRAAVRMVRAARPGVTAEHHEELCAASRALLIQIGPLGWPETLLVGSLLHRLELRSQDALAEGHASRAAVESVSRVLERADEAALAAVIRDPEQLALLPVTEIRRIHADLLGLLRFADADVLRVAVTDRIRLPTATNHRMPLFAAVAGGTFLVLDVGEPWLALVHDHAWGRYGFTVGLALAASYGLLLNDLGPRLTAGPTSAAARWGTLAIRALPTFLLAGSVSVGVSALAMSTLGLLAPTAAGVLSLLLWSALALFLGVFIGLIAQGESATRR